MVVISALAYSTNSLHAPQQSSSNGRDTPAPTIPSVSVEVSINYCNTFFLVIKSENSTFYKNGEYTGLNIEPLVRNKFVSDYSRYYNCT